MTDERGTGTVRQETEDGPSTGLRTGERPFDGIKILDFSRQAPGPFCTMVLADFGAEVTLVEPPKDVARRTARLHPRERLFDPLSRGKRSIILDFRRSEAREVVRRLVRTADVLVEGFRPGVADRLGFGWEAMHSENPGLIYCSISGYGQDGPERTTAGHDINYLARAGGLHMFRLNEDAAPVPPMNILGDYAGGGLLAAFAIAAALVAREQTGEGQYIDVSMTDGVLYLMAAIIGDYFRRGRDPRPGKAAFNGLRPNYNVYRTKDGRWLALGSEEERFWRNLCDGLGRPDLVPRLGRASEWSATTDELRHEFAKKTARQWLRHFRGRDVCLEPVLTLGEALKSPLARARQMWAATKSDDSEVVPTVGVAPKLSLTPGRPGQPAHQPGRDTPQVLREAGYSDDAIQALLTSGAAAG